jgi:hypothetical protein
MCWSFSDKFQSFLDRIWRFLTTFRDLKEIKEINEFAERNPGNLVCSCWRYITILLQSTSYHCRLIFNKSNLIPQRQLTTALKLSIINYQSPISDSDHSLSVESDH